ncbi:MAG: ABC transporter substrate-binding protein [Kiritimatiellaeota bacterium]|nr:ABC transporter substrate-binding protein [Kiritimatiellota bacterium]
MFSRAAAFRRPMERVSSLDPAQSVAVYSSHAVALVYETLLRYAPGPPPYTLEPALATALPEVSDDGLTLTFTLDPAARFWPDPCLPEGGRPLLAHDVVYTLKRLCDKRGDAPSDWILLDRVRGMRAFADATAALPPDAPYPEFESLRALDDHTVRILLARPSPELPWLLTLPSTGVVPHEAVAFYKNRFGERSVGSGPYRLASWRRNHKITFERVPAWRGWDAARGGPAFFDRVEYLQMDDPSTQWLAFLSWQLDVLPSVSRDNWDAVVLKDGTLAPRLAQRGVTLHTAPALEVAYVSFNMDDPVVGPNKKLRQALNAAFDAHEWAAFHNHRVRPANGPVPPHVNGHDDGPFPYSFNPALAARLLAEAGYPGGVDPATGRPLALTLELGKATQDTKESSELFCAQMARVGVHVTASQNTWPAFLKKIARREAQMFRIGWVADYPDAENFLQLFYSPNASPGPNRSNYSNPAFDRLHEAAAAERDPPKRDALYAEMQVLLREDCPWIYLNTATAYSLSGPRVSGYFPHPFPYGMEIFYQAVE